jgi:hypothetical protein
MFLLPTLFPRFYVRPLEGVVRAWTQHVGAMPELFPCHLHRRLHISACAIHRCSATSISRTSGLQPAVRTPIEGQPCWSPRGWTHSPRMNYSRITLEAGMAMKKASGDDSWYVANVTIIFDALCLFYTNCFMFCLHFVVFLCIFRN